MAAVADASTTIENHAHVVDRELQETVYLFEHTHGIVERIDQESKQLAEALAGEGACIVVSIQKFPFLMRRVEAFARAAGDASADASPRSVSGPANARSDPVGG